MKLPSRKTLVTQLLPLLGFVVVFLIVSMLTRHYHEALGMVLQQGGIFGIILFTLLTAVFVVFVIPLDIVFLIPLGAVVWGPLATAGMSIAGWVLGAAIAFTIARRLGLPVVGRMIGLSRIRAIEKRVPKSNIFWSVVFLRMLVSVDILSYALGLFSPIPWRTYLLATAIGVTPFGFYFAYAGALPFWYQLPALVAALTLATFFILRYGLAREP